MRDSVRVQPSILVNMSNPHTAATSDPAAVSSPVGGASDAAGTHGEGESATIRILVVDDHAIVRAGLKQFIANEPDMRISGEAETGTQAVAMIAQADWDIVILDISMPDQNGVDTLRRI